MPPIFTTLVVITVGVEYKKRIYTAKVQKMEFLSNLKPGGIFRKATSFLQETMSGKRNLNSLCNL